MHLIVDLGSTADSPAAWHGQRSRGQGPADPPRHAELSALWSRLSEHLRPTWRLEGEADALSTTAERARERLLFPHASPAADGQLPWAAWDRRVHRLDSNGAWGRLVPYHGLVGSDRITLLPPASLDLSEHDSRELLQALAPLFASEGVELEWRAALAWHVRHESLEGLACASLDRAMGGSVQQWQGRTPLKAARLLRRLQSESQMVLHAHPLNEERASRGWPTVNSLWLDHGGALPESWRAAATTATSAEASGGARPCAPVETVALESLADAQAAEAGSAAAVALNRWFEGFAGTPGATLVLCGARHAQAFTAHTVSGTGWSRWMPRLWGRTAPTARPWTDWVQEL